MVNDIINGLAVKLNEVFGADYKIYKESIEQGFREPCFSIVLLESLNTPKLQNRYLRETAFDIHYFPKSTTGAKNEMYEIAEQLILALEHITVKDNGVDSLCRGSKMRYEIVDNVLHFFVNYDLFVMKELEKSDGMKSVAINSKTEA
ncbi:MAG: hypothetical protein IKB61_00555 [Elusimicrobiaceae bacterium]|nr:hypothetical protein [Elusimicrobiaceae bacterium]